jgi:DNA-binding HxlR family transcriptional regulator
MTLGYLDSAILIAIARGYNTLSSLKHMFPGVDPGVLESRLKTLESMGYVRSRVKGLIFKTKEYYLTEKGAEALNEASARLEEAAEEIRRLAQERRPVSEWSGGAAELAWIIPLLLWLGLLDLALLPLIGMEFVDDVGDFGEDLETGYEDAEFGEIEF